MSWKNILKNVRINPNELCCEVVRRKLLDFLEDERKMPTFGLNRISGLSCEQLDNYIDTHMKYGEFDPEQSKAFMEILQTRDDCEKENQKFYDQMFKGGDNFKREKSEGLHGWFSRRGGKESKGGKTQGGWIDCGSCGSKGGPKPCGRKDASKGTKRRCRPTCSACKTYKRRKGSP
tara:strand:- start:8232 stop:8759 length:528 start_codon:yes stop_codon:yes gene_type:complete